MSLHRRALLKAGLAAAGVTWAGGLGSHLARAATTSKQLVYIFLRGGADALGMVAPVGAAGAAVAAARPNLAIASPIAFSTELVFHPQLAPLLNDSVLKAGLNVVLHAGSLHETRSHFEQMAHIESGDSSGIPTTGFLGAGAKATGLHSAALGSAVPHSLHGSDPVVLNDPERLQASYAYGSLKPRVPRATRMALYKVAAGETGDTQVSALATAAEAQLNSLSSQLSGITLAQLVAAGQYLTGSQFGARLACAAALIGTTYKPAFIAVDAEHGWDTHANQATNDASGAAAYGKKVSDFARNLVAFKDDLVARGAWANTAVVVMTEFGRTVRENANKGTDHGRGGIMFLMGGTIRPHADSAYLGLRSYSIPTAPTASTALDVVHDYRVVMAELIERHLGVARGTTLGLFKPTGTVSAADYLNVVK